MIEFLKGHKCLSVLCLEREAQIPFKTLNHALAGRRKLTKEHIEKLTPVLIRYGFKPKRDFSNTSNCELASKGMEPCENNCGSSECKPKDDGKPSI